MYMTIFGRDINVPDLVLCLVGFRLKILLHHLVLMDDYLSNRVMPKITGQIIILLVLVVLETLSA